MIAAEPAGYSMAAFCARRQRERGSLVPGDIASPATGWAGRGNRQCPRQAPLCFSGLAGRASARSLLVSFELSAFLCDLGDLHVEIRHSRITAGVWRRMGSAAWPFYRALLVRPILRTNYQPDQLSLLRSPAIFTENPRPFTPIFPPACMTSPSVCKAHTASG